VTPLVAVTMCNAGAIAEVGADPLLFTRPSDEDTRASSILLLPCCGVGASGVSATVARGGDEGLTSGPPLDIGAGRSVGGVGGTGLVRQSVLRSGRGFPGVYCCSGRTMPLGGGDSLAGRGTSAGPSTEYSAAALGAGSAA
jgi:hypothetical protein